MTTEKGGRPRTPTALRVLTGTHRKDRHGDPSREPGDPIAAVPDAPDSLGEPGKAAWLDTLGKIIASGYVSDFDLSQFTDYCRTFDEIAAIDEAMVGEDRFYITDKGNKMLHPLIGERFRWLEMRRKLAQDFWLNPTARAGKQVAPKKATTVLTRKRG